MAKKRRTKKAGFETPSGEMITENYCRYCMTNKSTDSFFSAIDFELDKNSLMSVCKVCINDVLYPKYYSQERTINKTLLKLCRTLNIIFDESLIDSVRGEISVAQEKGKNPKPVFSMYKSRVSSSLARSQKMESGEEHDLRFYEPSHINIHPDDEELMVGNEFWGKEFILDDVEFLEKRFSDFKRTHVVKTASEVELLKLVCYNLLNIERARAAGKSTTAEVKQLQNLMKTLAVSPDMQNSDSSDKNLEIYGLRMKYIEENDPGEFLNEQKAKRYEDLDGYNLYYENFLRRPTINYNGDLANYKIVNDEGEEDDWEIKD